MYDILIKIGADVSDFSRKLAESQRSLQDFGKANQQTFDSFKKTGTMLVAAGTGISMGLGKAVGVASSFSTQMSKVKAISGATDSEFATLNDTAKKLGATTVFSASQAGEGMEYLALAGWKTNEIVQAMPGMLDLAAAGALDLGRAADITSDTMSAFGLSADKAGHAADVFAYAQANANTNVEQMGEAMNYLAPTANSLGWSLEEASAIIMELANNGLKGSMATQAFGSSLVRLSAPTPKAAKLIKKLGMEFFDAEGNMKSMPEVVAEMEKGLEGMSDKQRAAAMDTLVGKNAFKQWQIILESGSESLAGMTENLVNADGSAANMAETMLDNLGGAIILLKSALEGAAISIGEILIPYIQKAVGWVNGLVDWFNNLSDATKEKIVILTALVGAFSLVGGAILLLIGFIPQILNGFQAVGTVIKSVGLLFTKASLPLIGFTLLIAGLVLGIIHLWRTNEEFRNNMTSIWESIQTLIVMVWEAIKPGALVFIQILGVLMGAISALIGWVAGVVSSILNWIVTFIQANSWILTVIQTLAIIAAVIGGVLAIVGVAIAIFSVLASIVKIVAAVFLFFTSPIGIIIAVIGILVTAIMWLGEKFEWIGNIVDKVSGWMSKAWNKFLGFFGKGTKDAADEAEESITGVAESGKESLEDFAESGTASAESLNEGVKSNVSDMSDFSIDEISAMRAEGLTDLESLNFGGSDAIENMSGSVTDDIADMANLGLDDLSMLEIGGIDAMSSLDAGVTSNVSNMTGDVIKEVGNMESAASGDFSGLTQDMSGNAKKVSDEVSKSFKGMSKSIEAEMNRIKKVSADGMRNMGQVMSTSMKSSLSLIQSTMNEISSGFRKGFSDINRTIVSGFRQVNSVSKSESTKFVNTIKLANSNATKAYTQGFRANVNAVRTGSNNAYTVVRNNNNRIVTSIRALNGQLRSAGAFAMSGLRSGLNAGAASVYQTARTIANRVANTMRSALQVRSPSRVMMEIGKWLTLGMAKGMDKYAGAVESSANSLAEAAIPSVDMSYSTPNGIASNLTSAISGTVDVNSRDDLLATAVDSLRRDLANLRVVMDGREVGEIVSPVVSEYIDESASRTSRRRGRRRI